MTKVGRRYTYVVRQRDIRKRNAWWETRKTFVVTEVQRGEYALVAENRLMARSNVGEIFFSSKGVAVDDQLGWPRYVIFPATMSTLAGAVHRPEIVVPAGKFSGGVEVVYRRGERPEGANRGVRISERIVFAKGIGVVRREVETDWHGLVTTTIWELAAIEEAKKEAP